ncbi:hypothetical protein LPJ66_008220 [Kickxella alabastrina]|uniref:Uncharacterized protein n=1 Tax=Kickxella alabastrina TaxID=61397 RepID=A0ACC1I6N7_9FUNG|nr:hypothetical protein LPJ66_008220 [Kickxella alabastrina]
MLARVIAPLRTSVAPMIDVTDPCFLRLLRLISPHGNHELWSEMVHARTFSHGKMHLDAQKLAQRIPTHELPSFAHGTVVQIGASSPADAAVAVAELGRLGVRHVNLNCGCPSRSVQMGSFGAVLMTQPQAAGDIVQAMVDAASDCGVHVSVKCRIGIDADESPEFLRRFIDSVLGAGRPVSLVLHARRAWLSGLSPEQNRIVPQLNHARGREMAAAYPQTRITANGGIGTAAAVHEHLLWAHGAMVGRKVREDPWFLALLDRQVYGVPDALVPTPERVLQEYVAYGDQVQRDLGVRHTVLARPLYALFQGRKARALRRSLASSIARAKAAGGGAARVAFSEVVADAVRQADADADAGADRADRAGGSLRSAGC